MSGINLGFSDTSSAGSTSSTTTTSIDKEGLQYLMKELLKSTSGLAAVTQGQMSNGLYNSSTNTLLANDLVTQASGYAASKNTTSTTNASTHQNSKSSSIGTVICTHMFETGRMTCEEYHTNHVAPKSPAELRGYHFWAIPLVKYLRKNTFIGRKLIAPIFYSLAYGRAAWYHEKYTFAGFVAVKVIQPLCGILGTYFILDEQNPGELYHGR